MARRTKRHEAKFSDPVGLGAGAEDKQALTSWLLGVLLVLATVLAYQQIWHAGYIWDDDVYVTANKLLTAPDGLRRIWFSLDAPSQYFPLVYTTFRLEHALWGLNPVGYHWVNLGLHAINALLVWRLLLALRIPGAWLGAAIFALHPVQLESVAWITERKNVLMGFFFLFTLLAWVRFLSGKSRSWCYYSLGILTYVLALSSKTTACTLPAALILILLLQRKQISMLRCLQIAPFVVLGAAMGAISVWWEKFHQGTSGSLFQIGIPERLLIATRAIWFYLGKLAWPFDLAFSYPRWPISSKDPTAYIGLGAAILLLLAFYLLRSRHFVRPVSIALLFFVATLSPMLGFIMLYTFRYSFVADHYQYLACLGPIALASAALTSAFDLRRDSQRRLFFSASTALLLALATDTWRHGKIYQNEEALWRATLAVNADSWLAHNNLGLILGRSGPLQAQLTEYQKAIDLEPGYAEAHNNLGYVLNKLGRTDEASVEFQKAIELQPRLATAHGNLATLLLQRGRIDDAIPHLEAALAVTPENAPLHESLGDIYAGRADKPAAIQHWRRALELDPKNSSTATKLGRVLADSGDLEGASKYLQIAAELEPTSPQAHYNYATALSQLHRATEAIAEYRETLRLQPDYAAAHVNLANTFLQNDQPEEAIQEYERGLELNPRSTAAHRNLAQVLEKLGRFEEAEKHLRRAQELEGSNVR